MALTESKLAYFREYRKAHKDEASAAFKRWHDKKGKERYYANLELTRAIKRKCYYKSVAQFEKAELEQKRIDELRRMDPVKKSGCKVQLTEAVRVVRRKASVRKARYKHVKGIPSLVEPDTCEICGRGGKICMDHCHDTNLFRGWICDDCNLALGRAKEDIGTLKSMVAYLERFENKIKR